MPKLKLLMYVNAIPRGLFSKSSINLVFERYLNAKKKLTDMNNVKRLKYPLTMNRPCDWETGTTKPNM